MHWKKTALVFAILAIFLSNVMAVELFYESNMFVSLNKTEFAPGETLEANIDIMNSEEFPIAEAYLVFELVQGEKYYYPSQTKDRDNVFFEENVEGVNIAPFDRVSKSFSYQLPSDLAPGSYRFDVYAKTKNTHMVGAPHIFGSPKSINFTVSGGNGSFPEVRFVRTKTRFHQFLGPVGPGIDSGEEIENEVFVQNDSEKTLKNLTLFVGLCEWDDTSCDSYSSKATEKIASLGPGEETAVSVKLTAPELPGAYSIRLELKDSEDKLISLYRNRSIVYGGTAKIHQLNVSDYIFNKGDEGTVEMLIGPSPDHYTWPSFDNFNAKVWIEDVRDNNSVVFTEEIPIVSIASPDFLEKSFAFTAEKELDLFNVCGEITKDGVEHESTCYLVDASLFPEKVQVSEIDVQWDYDFSEGTLNLVFSNIDSKVNELDAAFLLMDFANNDLVVTKSLKDDSPMMESLEVPPKNFVLILNNFTTRKQQKIEINLEGLATAPSSKPCSELGGILCSAEQICSNPVPSSEGSVCCLTECNARVSTGQQGLPWDSVYSFIFWIVVIIIVLAVLYNIYIRTGNRGNEQLGGGIIENDL